MGKLTLKNGTAAVQMRGAVREAWRTAGKRRRAIRPPLAVGERILLCSGWLCTLTNGTPYSIDSLSSGCSTFDLYAHHLRLTVTSGESLCSITQRRYSMNSKDCGMTSTEEYMYIIALIAAVLLFRIHCHMAHTILEISHSLSNQVRISFNLANFAWSPPAICLIWC